MKTKKLLLACAVFLSANLMALDLTHGSMMGNGLPLYEIRDGEPLGAVIAGTTFDYKMVTAGTKTWAWTNLTGKNISGNAWSSQLRFWQPIKLENTLTGRVSGTQQTYGTAGLPTQNPCTITFLQEENNAFFETADLNYNYTLQNSKDATDNTAPVLANPVVDVQTALRLDLTLSATDNSTHFFYYIEDKANNFAEVSFVNKTSLTLVAGTQYTFSIYAIDFSGNASAAKTVQTEQIEPVYFTEGTANDLSFKLDSRSLNELRIQCTSTKAIGDAFVSLVINGNTIMGADNKVKEWKPNPALDNTTGSNTYTITVPAADVPGWAENVVLTLNLGYITAPVGNWGHYVLENRLITAGVNSGSPIFHKIGTGVDITEPKPQPQLECSNNLLENAVLSAGTVFYATTGDWVVSTNYTQSFENNIWNIHLGDATNDDWQAQFPLLLETPLQLSADKKYGISVTVETDQALPFYVKFMDVSNNYFFEIARTSLAAPGKTVGTYDLAWNPDSLTQISKILFDFGKNTANTNIKISEITVCDEWSEASHVGGVEKNAAISVYHDGNALVISAENKIKSARMFTVNGQVIDAVLENNLIRTDLLPKGMYVLHVADAAGSQTSFKVLVK